MLWNIATGELLKKLIGHTGNILDVAFHPQGTLLASSSLDSTINLRSVLAKMQLSDFGHLHDRVIGNALKFYRGIKIVFGRLPLTPLAKY